MGAITPTPMLPSTLQNLDSTIDSEVADIFLRQGLPKKINALFKETNILLGPIIHRNETGSVRTITQGNTKYVLKTLIHQKMFDFTKYISCNGIRGETLALQLQGNDLPNVLLKTHALVIYNSEQMSVRFETNFVVNSEDIVCAVITECVPGSKDLFEWLSEKSFSNHELKKIAYQVLQGLIYLHEKNLIHRDIKPENILYNDKTKEIKIIDFGFLRHDTPENRPHSPCGSVPYCPPEVVLSEETYNSSVDLYSFGMMFLMLKTQTPIFSQDQKEFFEQITQWKNQGSSVLSFLDSTETEKDPVFFDFIKHLITTDPRKRLSAVEALQHPFFSAIDSSTNLFRSEGNEREPLRQDSVSPENQVVPTDKKRNRSPLPTVSNNYAVPSSVKKRRVENRNLAFNTSIDRV